MTINNALASIPVTDLHTAIEWYKKLLGREPDAKSMAEVAEWKFNGGGWLQIYENKQRAGYGSVTLAVADIGEQIAALGKLGIAAGELIKGEQVNVIMIKDPDGNSIAFAKALNPDIAQ